MTHTETRANAPKVERDFQALCQALDRVPPDQHAVLLAKLALVLCSEIDDARTIDRAIEVAARDLPRAA
ncbi:MAG: hypothetical protein AB7P37_13930 [Ramlibacter sp.]